VNTVTKFIKLLSSNECIRLSKLKDYLSLHYFRFLRRDTAIAPFQLLCTLHFCNLHLRPFELINLTLHHSNPECTPSHPFRDCLSTLTYQHTIGFYPRTTLLFQPCQDYSQFLPDTALLQLLVYRTSTLSTPTTHDMQV